MLWYARIGVYFSISRNSICNYTHNFKTNFLNKNYALALIIFCQYFLLWISFLGKFLQNSYLFLNSFTCLCAKDVYRFFYRKLTAVVYMSSQRFYCKLMTYAPKMLLNICNGDIETDTGPKKNTKISFCHWNLNRIAGHNFSKVSLLQAMATKHECDIIFLSKAFLDSSFNSLDDRINVERKNILRADHPNDNNRGGVCMYFKEHVPILRRDD